MKWLPKFLRSQKYLAPSSVTRRELIQREAKIGGQLFGFLAPNRRRDFFCLDEATWVWYEEWQDHRGTHRFTTRYEIHGDNILKLQNDKSAELVTGHELDNFYNAVRSYYYAVSAEVYHRPIPQ